MKTRVIPNALQYSGIVKIIAKTLHYVSVLLRQVIASFSYRSGKNKNVIASNIYPQRIFIIRYNMKDLNDDH
jgi:hypothetical protein